MPVLTNVRLGAPLRAVLIISEVVSHPMLAPVSSRETGDKWGRALTSTQMLHQGQWKVRGGRWKQHFRHHCRRKALWFTHTTGIVVGPCSSEPGVGRGEGSSSQSLYQCCSRKGSRGREQDHFQIHTRVLGKSSLGARDGNLYLCA